MKGLETPTPVYELTGSVPARSRLQASAARGLTRFVGREVELHQLARVLERAAAGHGQTVAVVGEAGVGKSRLFWEFTRSHRTHGWLVLESGSVSYGKATPYLPVIELLKSYCRIQERDDQREIRERVAGKLLTLDRALEPLLTPLLALLDVPFEDPTWDALDPPQRRQQTLDAVKRLLLRESQVQPLLVIFEDLHWMDSETQALLDGLLESLPTARILLLVNYRPEYEHAWGRKTYYFQLRIDPLPPESADALLNGLLGEDRTLEPLKRVLIERTEGNPFFLEESVRTLVETEVLVGDRGAYRMAKVPKAWQIPATAQAILAARIDRLPAEDKRLLQAASVVGKDVPLALLQAIADVPEESLRGRLTHLQAAEFLYEMALFPDLEYTFKHALTHEVAYASLLGEQKRALHARIVNAIERAAPDRRAEYLDRLADHAFRADLWDKALVYSREAAAKAAGRSAYREALSVLERAQVASGHLPDRHETFEQGVDLRLDFQNVFNALGDLPRMLDSLREAERLAESLGDAGRLARVLAYLSRCFWWMGRPRDSLAAGERALSIASSLEDPILEAVANYHVGLACVSRGDFGRAIAIYRRSGEILHGPRTHERFGMPALPSVIALAWHAYSLAALGDFAAAVSVAGRAVRLADSTGHPYSMGVAIQGMGEVHLFQGDLPKALDWLERGLSLAKNGDFAVLRAIGMTFLGRAFALAGRVDEGLRFLEDAMEYSASIQFMAFQPVGVTWVADTYVRAGRIVEAEAMIERALDLTRTHEQRASEAEALLTLGAIRAMGDAPDLEQASSFVRDALSLADELGTRPLVARCHLDFGRLYRRGGDREDAREQLTTAARMFREMDMRFWLKQAEDEMRSLT